jgi:Domain of unknown function (DUF5664)
MGVVEQVSKEVQMSPQFGGSLNDRFAPSNDLGVAGLYDNDFETYKKPDVGGVKHDSGKPDFTYISYELLEQIALVREFGAKKYSRDNWKLGFKVTRSLAAVLRHIFLFLRGETLDPESGLSHLAHAACGLEHAIYDMAKHPENDDR